MVKRISNYLYKKVATHSRTFLQFTNWASTQGSIHFKPRTNMLTKLSVHDADNNPSEDFNNV